MPLGTHFLQVIWKDWHKLFSKLPIIIFVLTSAECLSCLEGVEVYQEL
jgi:hypothetical protein